MGNLTTKNDEKQVTTAANRQDATTQRPERTIAPRASVYETPNDVTLELEMPGVARDTIDVSVENDELTVFGRRVLPADEGAEWLHQERLPFNYRRAFILSERIDSSTIGATYMDGVLKLTLPKAAEAKPRRIEIE